MTASLTEQLGGYVDLAGWDDAWLHEARGYHGKWVKAGEGTSHYSVPDHSRLVLGHGAYSEPGNHPFFKANPISAANVVKTYDATTPQERAQGARWYADAHDVAAKMADGDATKGAILLASYSPQSSWPVNMFNAARAAKEHRALGPGDGLITGDMQKNAQEGLDGESIDQAMTSPKTRAFARLIELGGDSPTDGAGEVVIDRHALSVAMGKTLPKKLADKAPIGSPRYHEYIADAYRQAALDVSKRDGKVVTPYQMQAITWLHQQNAVQAADTAASTAGSALRGGKGLSKGRMTMTANAWKRWMSYAAAGGLPAVAGTTSLAAQITELLAEQSISGQIELAYNALQPRDKHGRWAHVPGEDVAAPITADEIGDRGNSRPVIHAEFQSLAAKGRSQLAALNGRHPVTGLDQHWPEIKAKTYVKVQDPWGGATIDAHTGDALETDADKYAITVKPKSMSTVSVPEQAGEAEFGAAMDRALSSFRGELEKGQRHLGIFHDDYNHRIDIDPVLVVSTLGEVDTIGAYTHAVGGAYHFRSGDGFWPPHVAGGADMANEGGRHFAGPGEWRSQAEGDGLTEEQLAELDDTAEPTITGQLAIAPDGTVTRQLET